ncbi:MAG: preprotein translocase subunit SecE [Clostridia bacterium]|nr:preprotein translocase subunit SecE [Clostridia bacterium]
MKTGNLLKRWSAAIVALLLTVVLFAIPAFAEDTTDVTTAEETTVEEVTTEAATDEHDHDHEEETTGSAASTENKTEEKKGMSTQTIITLCIFGVLIVAAVVLGIIFREKVGKFLRVYKSEAKKIVWLPWDQTKKSTLVVLVVLVVCALAICLLDFALGQGYLAFLKLF